MHHFFAIAAVSRSSGLKLIVSFCIYLSALLFRLELMSSADAVHLATLLL